MSVMLFLKRITQLMYSRIKLVLVTYLIILVILLITPNIIVKIRTNDLILFKQVSHRNNVMFTDHRKTFETRIECIGSLYNQSCLFHNLYYVNSEFIILTIKGKVLPFYSVRTNSFDVWPTVIKKREFDAYIELEQFVRTVIEPTIIPLTTVYFVQEWHYNIGHALFDGLYPAYIALIRFSPRHLQPFRILTELRDCQKCWSEDIYRRFSGLGILHESILREMSARRWFMFEEILMGSGTMCQRCTQPNFQLSAGVELDASRLFRDRIYKQHGLIQPVIRRKSSSEYRTSRDIIQGYVIHNKRFTDNDMQQINKAIDELNNYTLSYSNQLRDTTLKLQWPLIHVTYLYYHQIKARHFNNTNSKVGTYELVENKFLAQLRILRQMDIHIAAPGTGQMYQTFLADGSVHINLGGLKPETAFASFGEQYMTSGTPYIKGLYYPINERPNGIKKDQLIKLIRQAAQMILQGFSLPVNPRENLAADGRLFIEMCEKDKEFCSSVTIRSPSTKLICFNFWIDELVHEHRQWKVGGVTDNGQNMTCYYNRTLLQQLREKYGIIYKNVDH